MTHRVYRFVEKNNECDLCRIAATRTPCRKVLCIGSTLERRQRVAPNGAKGNFPLLTTKR